MTLEPTAQGAFGPATITAHVPFAAPGVVPVTSGSNSHTLHFRPPVPHLETSFDGTSRTLSVVATFRDSTSPTSDEVKATGLTVADFNIETTGGARLADIVGAAMVRPLGASIGWEYARWQLDLQLRLPLDAGTVVVGIGAASGHVRPTPAPSVPARLQVAGGGPVPTLSTTGFSSGDAVLGPFQVTSTYSAPVSGVDTSTFDVVTVPADGVHVATTVSPAASEVSTTWVVHVTVSGPNAAGATVYVYVSDDVEGVTPLPGSPINSPVIVRCGDR